MGVTLNREWVCRDRSTSSRWATTEISASFQVSPPNCVLSVTLLLIAALMQKDWVFHGGYLSRNTWEPTISFVTGFLTLCFVISCACTYSFSRILTCLSRYIFLRRSPPSFRQTVGIRRVSPRFRTTVSQLSATRGAVTATRILCREFHHCLRHFSSADTPSVPCIGRWVRVEGEMQRIMNSL